MFSVNKVAKCFPVALPCYCCNREAITITGNGDNIGEQRDNIVV